MDHRHNFGMLGLSLLTGLLVLVFGCAESPADPTPTPSPTAAPLATASPAEATRVPAPEPTPVPTPSTLVVANTGGEGVFIRRTPGGKAIRAWPDGAKMVVVGGNDQAEGTTWKNVRDPDGNEGWIATGYLAER